MIVGKCSKGHPYYGVERYCPECGEKRGTSKLCPRCFTEFIPQQRFCYHCGLDLKESHQ